MKFKINDRDWEILEVNQAKMRELEHDEDEKNTYFGLTNYEEQLIYIWEDLHPQQKRQTLIHELFHCYVGCYYSFQDTAYSEEIVCNLVGNSHDIIHKIVDDYFAEKEIIKIEMDKIKCDVENLTKLNKSGNIKM